MSSTYYTLCLSHDPAIIVSERNNSEGYAGAAEAIADGFEVHQGCDFLIMRVSGAPIEFACTGKTDACRHTYLQEVDADWLRILILLNQYENPKVDKLRDRPSLRCWSDKRLHRLRNQL